MKVLLITSLALLLTGCPGDKKTADEVTAALTDDKCASEDTSTTALVNDSSTKDETCPKAKADKAKADEKTAKADEKTAKADEKASSSTTSAIANVVTTAIADMTSTSAVKYALISFNVDSYSFSGGVLSTESEYTMTVSNKGDASATAITLSALVAPYRVVSKTCEESLATNTDCTIKIGYTPTAIGTHTASLAMGYNDGQEVKSKSFGLSGLTSPSITSINPAATVATQVLTIVGQNFTSQTSIKIGATECTKLSTVASQITCSIPVGSGAQVVSASESSKESLYSSFTYLAPANLAVTSSYDFSNVRKTNTASGSLTLTNNGGFAASSISLSGVSAPLSASSGCTSLAVGSSCTITLGYAPTSVGANSATLSISYHNGTTSSSTSSSISGTGIPKVIQVAAGNAFSCLLYSEGNIKCVGLNRRLGNGTNDNIYVSTWATATEVSGISNATQISLYDSGGCAVLATGAIKCWGMFKMPDDGTYYTTPETISGISNAASISYANSMISVRTSDGYIKSWGRGTAGQLGGGNLNNSSTSVNALGIPSTYQVINHAAGNLHQVVVTSTGSVVTWGLDILNLNNSYSNFSTPYVVAGLSNISSATAGQNFSCALNSSGNVLCWGKNEYGQRGLGITTPNDANLPNTPNQVSGISNATAISSGAYHSCAIKSDKTVYCWGYNQQGQIGNGNASSTINSASTATGLSNVSQISTGYLHTMALTETGNVYVWGNNTEYQLGLGDNTSRTTPVNINIQ
jgi:alpha-tubulin suppressor-like RCC1 family protein